MQKINRDALKEALNYAKENTPSEYFQNEEKYTFEMLISNKDYEAFLNAAAILLKLTDPEFVPSKGMLVSEENAASLGMLDDYGDIFRAMMKEICE